MHSTPRLHRIHAIHSMYDSARSASTSSLLYETPEALVANSPRLRPASLSVDRLPPTAGAVLRPPPGFGRTTPASPVANPRKRTVRPPLTRNAYPIARRPPPPPPRRASAPNPEPRITPMYDTNPFESPADIHEVHCIDAFSSSSPFELDSTSILSLSMGDSGRTSAPSITAFLPQGLMIQLHEDDMQTRRELAERERLSRWRIVAGMLLNRGGIRPLTRKPMFGFQRPYVPSGLSKMVSVDGDVDAEA